MFPLLNSTGCSYLILSSYSHWSFCQEVQTTSLLCLTCAGSRETLLSPVHLHRGGRKPTIFAGFHFLGRCFLLSYWSIFSALKRKLVWSLHYPLPPLTLYLKQVYIVCNYLSCCHFMIIELTKRALIGANKATCDPPFPTTEPHFFQRLFFEAKKLSMANLKGPILSLHHVSMYVIIMLKQ